MVVAAAGLEDLLQEVHYRRFASLTTSKVSDGLAQLAKVIQSIGEADLPKTVSLPGGVRLAEAGAWQGYDRVTVERRMKSITRPGTLKLEPTRPQLQGKRLILKPKTQGRRHVLCASSSGSMLSGDTKISKCVGITCMRRHTGCFWCHLKSRLWSAASRWTNLNARVGGRVARHLDCDGRSDRLDLLATTTAG